MKRLATFLLASLSCAGLTVAQHAGRLDRDTAASIAVAPHEAVTTSLRSGGLDVVDGLVQGWGVKYRVQFDQDAVAFVPAFGPRAERLHPVRFRLESVRRQGGDPVEAVPARQSRVGTRVEYTRPGYVETYDVLEGGVEQSFVFSELPAGAGNLIVRGRLDTDLAVSPAADGGLRLVLDGVGEMAVGAVTGIDARGRTAAGTLRYEAGVIELVLPGDFVDSAALPLVLDPLIGGVVTVEGSVLDDGGSANVAFDDSHQVYCVVWEEVFSTNDIDVRARRVAANGMPLGTEVAVTSTTTRSRVPRVASCAERDRFVIVWEDNRSGSFDIWGRTMSAANGALGTASVVRGDASSNRNPDVGGALTGDRVYVVYDDQTEDDIEGLPVTVTAGGALVNGAAANITTASGTSQPRISKSAGPGQRHFVVWQREVPGEASNVEGRVLGLSGATLSVVREIASAFDDEDDPVVDGDGTSWVVAYEIEATPVSGNNDVACRSVRWSFGGIGIEPEVLVESGGEEERNPSVAWCGGSVLVAFEDQTTGADFDTYVAVIDPFSGQPLASESGLRTSPSIQSVRPEIASVFSGSGDSADDQAFLVWEDVNPPDTGTVFGRVFRADDGVVTTLGGGCGDGGLAHASGALVGNSGFAHRLRAAELGSTAYLLLSFARLDVACGACTIVPDVFAGFTASDTLNCLGDATAAMPIPNSPSLAGLVFYEQWLVVDQTSPACGALSANLSNAIAVEIQ